MDSTDTNNTGRTVECPICTKHLAESEINTHVNECLNSMELGNDDDFEQETSFELPSSGNELKFESVANEPLKASFAGKGVSFATEKLQPSSTVQTQDIHDIKDPEKFSKEESRKDVWSLFKSPKSIGASSKSGRKSLTQSNDMFSSSSVFSLTTNSRKTKADSSLELQNNSHATKNNISKRPRIQHDMKSSVNINSKSIVDQNDLPEATVNFQRNTVATERAIQPLAERMRPASLVEFVGQDEVVGERSMLRKLLELNHFRSMIFWGPPGCGKTTLARIVANRCRQLPLWRFVQLSATTSGISDIKEAIQIAKNESSFRRKTILFIDEIHRFNKLQQDAFLPHVEDGTIVLIGATTENPSFHVNNALLSRCQVLVFEKLSPDSIEKILGQTLAELNIGVLAENKEDLSTTQSNRSDFTTYLEPSVISRIAQVCDGDARCALNTLQNLLDANLVTNCSTDKLTIITEEDVKECLQRSSVQYDRVGEEHYNCASALQKSIRGSDDNGAIYWLARMVEGGEDPLFIARRLVVCASEDIGLADVHALPLAVATFQACHFIGLPECALNLAHCTTYLARAPKSNEAYAALSRARASIREHAGPLPGVPLHLRNAPTKLMKDLGYHKGYQYNHNIKGPVQQQYLPDELHGISFFKMSHNSQQR